MFEATTATQIEDKGVVIVRQFAAKDLGTFLDDLSRIRNELFRIVVSLARDHISMRLAEHVKLELCKITHLKRRVVQHVIVLSLECIFGTGNSGQSGSHFPVAKWNYTNSRRDF